VSKGGWATSVPWWFEISMELPQSPCHFQTQTLPDTLAVGFLIHCLSVKQ